MTKVIKLNQYKEKKDNEILLSLKEKINQASSKERKRFFKYWRISILISTIFQCIFTWPILHSVGKPVIPSTISFLLGNLILWATLELFRKYNGSVIFTNHFKNEKEYLLRDIKWNLNFVTCDLKHIFLSYYRTYIPLSCKEHACADMHEYLCNRGVTPDEFQSLMNTEGYAKFKNELLRLDKALYLKLCSKEKSFYRLRDDINLLSNITKKELSKIS